MKYWMTLMLGVNDRAEQDNIRQIPYIERKKNEQSY